MCCRVREALAALQEANVLVFEAEHAQYLADGNEFYAAQVEADIANAKSLARLVHVCPSV